MIGEGEAAHGHAALYRHVESLDIVPVWPCALSAKLGSRTDERPQLTTPEHHHILCLLDCNRRQAPC